MRFPLSCWCFFLWNIASAQPIAQPALSNRPIVEIRGLLVEAGTGKPLDNVEIGVHWRDHRRAVGLGAGLDQTYTSADGSFTIRTPMSPAEPFRIHVEGKNTIEFITPVFESLPAEPLRIESPASGGWIAGRVVTSEGQPVPGGFIRYSLPAADADMALLNDVPVEASGDFLIGPLAIADYSLVYVFHDAATRQPIESRPLLARPTPDPVNQSTEIVFIAKSLDVVKVHVFDPDGNPLTAGWVYAKANTEKGSLEFGARINEDGVDRGTATLVGTFPGRYIVRLSEHEEFTGWIEFAYTQNQLGGPTVTDVTLQTRRGTARIEGRVLIDGHPSSSTRLFFYPQSVGAHIQAVDSQAITCNSEGRFVSKLVLPGKCRLLTDTASGLSRFEEEFDLAEGETRNFDIELQTLSSARLAGRVIDDRGNPIPNAWVKIYRSASNLYTQTGPDGRYDIACPENPHANRDLSAEYRAKLLPGQERIEIFVTHNDFSGPARRYVVVTPNETTQADFTLHPFRPVTVECRLAEGIAAADLPSSFSLPLTNPFGTGMRTAPHAVPVALNADGHAVVKDYPFPQDVYGRFYRDDGSPVRITKTEWIRDGVVVATDRHGIPLDDPAPYTIRLFLAPEQKDPTIHLRLVDHLTGEPVEAIRIVVRDPLRTDFFHTLPDGRCTRPYKSGNPLLLQNFFAVKSSAGELTVYNGESRLNLPLDFRSEPQNPVEIRGFHLLDRKMIYIELFDSFGANITGRVTALDGEMEWKPILWNDNSNVHTLAICRTAGDIHEFMFLLDSGDASVIDPINPLPPGVSLAKNKSGFPVLRIDFGHLTENFSPLRIRLKDAMFIPGIDEGRPATDPAHAN